jgi:hypothetical protein
MNLKCFRYGFGAYEKCGKCNKDTAYAFLIATIYEISEVGEDKFEAILKLRKIRKVGKARRR